MDRHEGIKSLQDQKTEDRPVTSDSAKQKQRPRESTPEMAALAGPLWFKENQVQICSGWIVFHHSLASRMNSRAPVLK